MKGIATMGSLFSGIGGLELGLERELGAETAWQVEQDEKCRRVLARHWPNAYRGITDVRLANRSTLSLVDLLCGGFPCQDVSAAGKGAGLAGARSGLWYEFRRVAEELAPPWIVVENVASGARRWLPHVRRDLHLLGYRTRAFQLSAFDCGAPHRRERVFVLAADPERVQLRDEPRWGGQAGAAPDADGQGQLQPSGGVHCFWRWVRDSDPEASADADRAGLAERGEQPAREERASSERGDPPRDAWTIEPPVCGVAHGVPGRVDRLRQLGNAVSPEQSAAVGRVIRAMQDQSKEQEKKT